MTKKLTPEELVMLRAKKKALLRQLGRIGNEVDKIRDVLWQDENRTYTTEERARDVRFDCPSAAQGVRTDTQRSAREGVR